MATFQQLKDIAQNLRVKPLNENLDVVNSLLEIYDDLKENQKTSAWYSYKPMVLSLLESAGLLPYVAENMSDLSLTDLLHLMPYEMEDGKFFHHGQIQALDKLTDINTKDLAIIAPTSFGKTKLLDVYIDRLQPNTVIIIQPTIALLQETFFRLKEKFTKDGYHICMDQEVFNPEAQKWISIWTQERCLEWVNKVKEKTAILDLFVIDEFYLIDPKRNIGEDDNEDIKTVWLDERAETLKYVYRQLKLVASKTLLLGPLGDDILHFDSERFISKFSPVRQLTYLEYEKWKNFSKQDADKAKLNRLMDIINETDAGLLIFRPSPEAAQKLAKELLEDEREVKSQFQPSQKLQTIINWLGTNYTESVKDWTVFKALRYGIGIHHGRMPRSLQKIILWLFNNGDLHSLIMTPTITQGVNTIAKSLVYWKNKNEGKNSIDFFAYKNIIGRAGRLGFHITGKIYLFDEPPSPQKIVIEMPEMEEPKDILEIEEFQSDEVDEEVSPAQKEEKEKLLKRYRSNFPWLRQERLTSSYEFVNKYKPYFQENTTKTWFQAENKDFLEELLAFCDLKNSRDYFRYTSLVKAFKTKTKPEFIKRFRNDDTDRAYYTFFDTLNKMQFNFPKGMSLLLQVAQNKRIIDTNKSEKFYKDSLSRSRFRTPSSIYALEEQGVPFHISFKVIESKNNVIKNKFESISEPTAVEIKNILTDSFLRQKVLNEDDIFILDTILQIA